VLRKVLPVGELELLLAALLDGHRRNIALAGSIAQDGSTKFLVNQQTNAILWHVVRNGLLEACIDDLLAVGNSDHLLSLQRFFPAEESRDIGRAVVERQDVERSCIAGDQVFTSFLTVPLCSS
jgi:hypothetical protein